MQSENRYEQAIGISIALALWTTERIGDGCCRTKNQVRQVAVVCRNPLKANFPHLRWSEGTSGLDPDR
jgi:hypothetical protein